MSAWGARETNTSVVSRAFRWARCATWSARNEQPGQPCSGQPATPGLEEEAVDDQLAAPVEQVEQARRPVRALEAVVLLDGHPRHPAPLGGERVAGAGELLLLHEQLLAGGLPLLGRDDRWRVHRDSFLLQVLVDDVEQAPPEGALAIHPVGGLARARRAGASRCVRPSTTRVTTPVSSSTFRCLEMAGFETPKPAVASPTVAGPAARRSTMPRRIGCDSALNGSLTTR